MRAGILLVMAAITFWKVSASAALVHLLGAVILGVLAVMAFAGR